MQTISTPPEKNNQTEQIAYIHPALTVGQPLCGSGRVSITHNGKGLDHRAIKLLMYFSTSAVLAKNLVKNPSNKIIWFNVLSWLGYTYTSRNIAAFKAQLQLLLSTDFLVQERLIMDNREQWSTLFSGRLLVDKNGEICLGKSYFEALVKKSVPYELKLIREYQGAVESTIYLWLSHRLYTLKKDTIVTFSQLMIQFYGEGWRRIKNYWQVLNYWRKVFKRILKELLTAKFTNGGFAEILSWGVKLRKYVPPKWDKKLAGKDPPKPNINPVTAITDKLADHATEWQPPTPRDPDEVAAEAALCLADYNHTVFRS